MFIFPDRRRRQAASRIHALRCIAAHIAAGNRLRRTLAALSVAEHPATQRAEAVLTPAGKVEDATGHAKSRDARQALCERWFESNARAPAGKHPSERCGYGKGW